MRKTFKIIGILLGVVVIGALGILYYAASNLNSIIAANRERVLQNLSAQMGREVGAGSITASLGWGVSAQITDLKIADDPAISQQPFLTAGSVKVALELIPLLARRVEVSEIVLEHPEIRLIQMPNGSFNVSSMAHHEAGAPTPREAGKAGGGAPAGKSQSQQLFVKNFTISDGRVELIQKSPASKIRVSAIDLQLRDFSLGAPFHLTLAMAALGDQQNIKLDLIAGPLMKDGAIDPGAIPVKLDLNAGPIDFAAIKTLPMLAKSIPPTLSITQPMAVSAHGDGTVGDLKFTADTDLSANQIAFGDAFLKPAATTLKVSAEGERAGNTLDLLIKQITLGDIEMKVTSIKLGEGATKARIDTNSFDLGSVAKLVPAMAKYQVSGKSEIHADVALADGKPSANGSLTLTGVGAAIAGKQTPPISNLSGTIKLVGTTADVGPIAFNVGSSKATLKSHVSSFAPVAVSFDFAADAFHLAEVAPSRPIEDVINRLALNGTATTRDIGPLIDAKLSTPSGNLNGVEYQNLTGQVSLNGNQARLMALHLNAFSGEIAATGYTMIGAPTPSHASISFSNLDIQKAAESQKMKVADVVRGSLGGNANLSAVPGPFDQMKSTFKGAGKLVLTNGKLVGVNVGAQTLSKIDNLPVVGSLVSPEVAARHPELFKSPDTDIQIASLTYTIDGPRITSRDIKVQTVDYGMTADGWFDMDKNIDLAGRLVLSRSFTQDLVAAKKQVAYVTNDNGEVDIPVQVQGQLPKPRVMPDVNQLAQQAGSRAVQQQGEKMIGKLVGKKAGGVGGVLGGLLGGAGGDNSGSGGAGAAPSPSAPSNPIDQLKGFFGR
jgi:uncharacterized protein involved in outer membrane biogenesis